MLPESPGAGGPADSEPLIFVSDASAEAERLTTALRMRGYVVIDVALSLLVSRVAVQRPSLILCDVDAPDALEIVGSLRDVPGGGGVDIVFIGEAGRTLDDMADAVFHESSGVFTRPVDVYALLRKVEALVGPPSTPGSSLMPPSQRMTAGAAASVRPSQPRFAEEPVARAASSIPPRVAPTSPPRISSSPPRVASSNPPRRLSSPPPRSNPPPALDSPLLQVPATPSSPALPPPVPLGFGMEAEAQGAPLARAIPQSTMSPELERLLARAEQRVTGDSGARSSVAPSSDRMAPEDEVEAVLPADVLAALDEPLGAEAEDDELGSSAGAGTHSGSEGGRTGTGTSHTGSGATNPGGGSGAHAAGATRAGSAPPSAPPGPISAQSMVTVPPVRAGSDPGAGHISEAPVTPPAIPTRPPAAGSWPPISVGTRLGTAVEPAEGPPSDGEPARGGNEPAGAIHGAPPAQLAARAAAAPESSTLPPGARGEPLTAPPRVITSAPAPRPAWQPEAPAAAESLTIPAALGAGDAVRALAGVVRARYTGALVFEDGAGIRRVVVRDGDFVTAASGVDGESLVAFLHERGVVGADVVAQLGRKVAQFGRHAGAALIAHGHLRQDELWPVLRAHAEWLLGRIVGMTQGSASLERQVPARLQAEPAVFGGATGAEVLVEIVRRGVPAAEARGRLGGGRARIAAGQAPALLSECALSDAEVALVGRAQGATVEEVLESTTPDFASVLHALVELGILDALAPSGDENDRDDQRAQIDRLDDHALRKRIAARIALVEEGDYFAILGVSRRATSYDIKRAYLELRRDFEPNRVLTPGTADLRDQVDTIREILDEAYDILRDQARRERYRRALEAAPH